MKHYKYLFMSVACFCLLGLIGLTYSKFTYSKEVSGSLVTIAPPSFAETLIENSILDTNVNFSASPSSTNGQGLMMRDGTQNDEYPIVYYRGNVTNNNLIFADLCWLIVRTTEKGGIKLIYNGEVNADGSCNNYSGVGGATPNSNYTNLYINNTTYNFNDLDDSPVYVGYMYNDDEKYISDNRYGNPDPYTFDATGYTAYLADMTIDVETNRHNQNKYDSPMKTKLDNWYIEKIVSTDSEARVEDHIWCNDRGPGVKAPIANFVSKDYFYYLSSERTDPTLICGRDIDKFTVNTSNGNGDLTYPIGLITMDEAKFAGMLTASNSTVVINYLTIGTTVNDSSKKGTGGYWTLSPARYSGYISMWYIDGKGRLYNAYAQSDSENVGIRPSIAISKDATIKSGNGSFTTPYIVG